jgi:formamidopyrimidine-DNA glycosylase
MPELPEVEVLRRGLNPVLKGRRLERMQVFNAALRWPVSEELEKACQGQALLEVSRRSKYLLFRFSTGTMLVHLGMSGTLQLMAPGVPLQKHDHVQWEFEGAKTLRLNDPRRFGSVLWLSANDTVNLPGAELPGLREPFGRSEPLGQAKPLGRRAPPCERAQSLLARLGLEPFDLAFSGDHLYRNSRRRKLAVKPWLLSGEPVVGVGNIYACEALFRAAIDPRRSAGRISRARYQRLAQAIIEVLEEAILAGGSTLRDFVSPHGESGAFQNRYAVYARDGKTCPRCGATIKRFIQAQRSSFACLGCQR